MSVSLKQIKAPIESELDEFEKRFRQSMKSNTPLLDRITHYIVKRKGKQMRPMFVFFCAKMMGKINDSTYNGAAMIELLHTATLVHDDVVDDSSERRGFFSVNALWKNKIAVLVGDYLLSKGLLISVDNGEFKLLQIMSNTVREMSEGELLQIEKARLLNITEEDYYTIIRQKTASLISSACSIGVASVTKDEGLIEKASLFGEKLGMAFQIRDDLFDFGSEEGIGKPTGIDIKEKKLTLPVIYALRHATSEKRRWLKKTIKKYNENKQKVAEIIEYVLQSGGIEYAQKAMRASEKEADDILMQFPDNDARTGLKQLIEYTTKRRR